MHKKKIMEYTTNKPKYKSEQEGKCTMSEEFQKENMILDKTEEEKKVELIMSVLKTKRELDLANRNFETAETGLVDYYAYQIKASKSKLDFLVSKARERGICLDMIEELYFRRNQVG